MAFPVVWMTVASIIAAFDITKSLDADGNVIEVDLTDDDCEGFCGMLFRGSRCKSLVVAP